MVLPMVGLAYYPLALWIPILASQSLSAVYLGSGGQGALRSLSGLLVDTPVNGFLKIVWVVMLVLCLDCIRGVFTGGKAAAGGNNDLQNAQIFELYAAKEGALVLGINLVLMMAIETIHLLVGRCIKLEMDRDIMKRQAEQASQFSKQLLAEDKKKTGVAPESKMPEAEEKKDGEAESELRKRD
eukprot:TRINITY_DN590_c1_g1_i1.p1 TRINITY_DN590_c1_g1~~TRINITY_DN590_c1_g1_i1.p1  ORF type:complete len:211 (+),score=51.65 TRINITY_DN590_c1_g1_i1:84-635(+)